MLKNVLSDDDIIKNTHYLFVLSSTTEGWRKFIVRNHPIGRFFIPRAELGRFSKEETIKLINKFLEQTEVTFPEEIKDLVFEYSQGHLFEVHAICSSLYENEINGRVTINQWDDSLTNGLVYLGNAVFENYIQELSEKEKELLIALAYFDNSTGLDRITDKCKKLNFDIKNINQHVRRLVEKGIIQNPSRGYYFIEDRLFRVYVKNLK